MTSEWFVQRHEMVQKHPFFQKLILCSGKVRLQNPTLPEAELDQLRRNEIQAAFQTATDQDFEDFDAIREALTNEEKVFIETALRNS